VAITQMISKESVKDGDIVSPLTEWEARSLTDPSGWMMLETFKGAVLASWEENGYDDSDFMASVWDGEKIKIVTYASTRGWTYLNGCVIDATLEVREAAAKYQNDRLRAVQVSAMNASERVASVGKTVKVTKGRKVPKGVIGEVFWVGADKYAGNHYGTQHRVGITTETGEKHFTAMSNVEVLNPVVHSLEECPETPVERMNFARPEDALAYLVVERVGHEMMAESGYSSNR